MSVVLNTITLTLYCDWMKKAQTNRQKKKSSFTQAQLKALDPYKYAARYHFKKSQENGHYYLKKQNKTKTTYNSFLECLNSVSSSFFKFSTNLIGL